MSPSLKHHTCRAHLETRPRYRLFADIGAAGAFVVATGGVMHDGVWCVAAMRHCLACARITDACVSQSASGTLNRRGRSESA